ncbi:ABC transporter permease [Comamonas testosteroni TK102]|uniref:ABC transporter permease n=1 Tax=Comamonas testosteroni TK102 TaxID=1392005 RepID=A0A076PEZ3_COMTE|nr:MULTISPECIES: ABC transporter permease [Comamonas]AIJ45354.1 ABC transporter permease [Comamonas testosteroni TK102]MPS88533.1 ABC transporter permease [Comamonas sp.]
MTSRSPLLLLLTSFSWQELRQHPWRTATALIAIMLGVALGFAVHVINQSALDEFSRAVRSVNGQPDLQLHAMQGGLPLALYPQVAQTPGVASAVPWVETTVLLPGSSADPQTRSTQGAAQGVSLRVLGSDALKLAPVAPALMPRLFEDGDRLDLFAPDAVFLNAAALQALRLSPEQAVNAPIRWLLNGQAQQLRIAGTVAASGVPLAVMDIAALQQKLGLFDRIDRLDLLLTDSASRSQVGAALHALAAWQDQILIQQPSDDQQRVGEMSRAYRVNLTVLALVALFTGAFLVFSVLALSVAQRAPQFALLAVLGATPRQRMALVLLEALALGTLGSLAGIALGTALAWLALQVLGGDLGGGFFDGVQPALHWSPAAALIFGLLGLAATLAGAWWPARAAMDLPPAATLKGLGSTHESAPRLWPAVTLLAASLVLAFMPPVAGVPLAAYMAVGLLLLGGMSALPWLLGAVLALVPNAFSRQPLAMLALERARRMRHATTVAVGGVVASLSLAVALTVMVTSFRGSMMEWLDAVLPAPLYVRAAGGSSRVDAALLPADAARRLERLPGIARAQAMRSSQLVLSPERPALSLLIRPLQGEQAMQLPWVQGPLHQARPGIAVHISEAVAQLYGLKPGDNWPLLSKAFSLQTQDHQAPAASFYIASVWRDYVRQFGAVALDWQDYLALVGKAGNAAQISEIAIWPETPGPDLQAAIEQALGTPGQSPPALEFVSSQALRERSLRIFDRSFAVTYWLQAVAIGIGLFGIAASFSAQVLARRKEFGLLAHLGLTRRNVLSVVAAEGLAWTMLGTIAGTLLGLGVAVILVHVVNPQSFHWTMELRLPLLRLLALGAAVVLAGVITAWLAGRRAASADAVLAVKEDW